VGKSYSGMVITGVAERVPERIKHLIYVDAVVPIDGQSFMDLFDPHVAQFAEEMIQSHGQGWFFPVDRSNEPRLAAQPAQTLRQRLNLQNPIARALPRMYIYCGEKRPDDPVYGPTIRAAQRAKAEGWRYRELATGHQPEVDVPEELASLLLEVA
jgi:pimeloyl-ACP methyl ester carboxylesterase